MNGRDIIHNDRSDVAAVVGLLMALLVVAVATVPAEWFIAALILVVLAMPALLVIEPALQRVRQTADLPLS